MAVLLAGLLLVPAGCTTPTAAPAGCRAGGSAAVLWSTENGAQSEAVYVSAGNTITERAVPYLGFPAVPAPSRARHGSDLLLASNGSMDRDRTHLVTLSTHDCSVAANRVPEALLVAVEESETARFTANWVNGSGWIRRHDKNSGAVSQAAFPAGIHHLVIHGDALYVFATDDNDNDRPMLLVLDSSTLEQRANLRLHREAGAVKSAIVQGDVLYFPYAGKGDGSSGEGTKLGAVNLRTHRVSAIPLTQRAPYVLVATDDAVYVLHTFLNPAFRPMADYVWLTRYRPATGSLESFDLGTTVGMGVLDLAVSGDALWLLGSDGDDAAILASFDLASMEQRSRLRLTRPEGLGHRYLAGLVVPD